MMVKRGEIYWVQLDPVKGSEQGGLRPGLVVQQDVGNRHSPTTVIVATTSTIPPRSYPFVVVIESTESGLPNRSAVNCARIATIQKDGTASRLRPPRDESTIRPTGQLSPDKMAQVDAALKYNLGLE